MNEWMSVKKKSKWKSLFKMKKITGSFFIFDHYSYSLKLHKQQVTGDCKPCIWKANNNQIFIKLHQFFFLKYASLISAFLCVHKFLHFFSRFIWFAFSFFFVDISFTYIPINHEQNISFIFHIRVALFLFRKKKNAFFSFFFHFVIALFPILLPFKWMHHFAH